MGRETPENEDKYSKLSRWEDRASIWERELARGTVKTLPEILPLTEDERLADELIYYLSTQGDPVTIPIIGGNPLLDPYSYLELSQLSDLKERLEQLPPFLEYPELTKLVVIALGRKLRVFPRKIADYYLYRSPDPEETWQGQREYFEVIYNILPLRYPHLPRYTYWHEYNAGVTTAGLTKGIVISVNRNLRDLDTTTPKSRLRNFFYTRIRF